MSVSIRLAKYGKKNAPSYKIAVSQTKTKRSGKFIDVIGFYNPSDPKTKFTLDKAKYEQWSSKGAIISDAVLKLVAGTYKYEKYNPKKAKEQEENAEKAAADVAQE